MLKILAIIVMTIDHIGHYFVSFMPVWLYYVFRLIGRFAFPIYCYFLALGYRRSKNVLHYGLRLLGFAFISELIIRYAHTLPWLPTSKGVNVLFTLSLGIVFLAAFEMAAKSCHDRLVRMEPLESGADGRSLPHQYRFNLGLSLDPRLGMGLGLLFMTLSSAAAIHFDSDYGLYGLLFILIFYLAEEKEVKTEKLIRAMLWACFLNLMFIAVPGSLHAFGMIPPNAFSWSPLQGFSVLAVPLCYLIAQSKTRPAVWQKYFFYSYYPLHILLLCWLLRLCQRC